MEFFNIDFEKRINFEKFKELFFIKFGNTKVAFWINTDFSVHFANNNQKADIFWCMDDLDGYTDIDGTYIGEYTDIKIRSYVTFSENINMLTGEFLLWLNEVSISLETKVYVDIELQNSTFGFSTSWCINGRTRSIVFEAEEVLARPDSIVPNFYYIEPIIDVTDYLKKPINKL